MQSRPFPLHPLLAAAYPVLFLFAANAADQVTVAPLWLPLAEAVGAAALVWLLLALLLRDPLRAALLTTLAIVLFFGYGHAWGAADDILDSQLPLLAAWALLAAVGLVAILRARRLTRPATRLLNVMTAIGVALNAWSIGGYALGASGIGSGQVALPSGAGEQAPVHRPDIYYIILDRYASLEALRETYEYDNTPFYGELEERGFYVTTASHSNYVKTAFSLVSSLSMDYLDADQLKEEAESEEDRGPIHRRLRDRLAVPAFLTELGYQYVHIGNWWEPTATNVDADRVFRYEGQSEFASALAETTLLRAFSGSATPLDPWDWRVLREHTLYQLERLEEIPALGSPKFVFAHLLVPHDPYVFDRDGSFMDRDQVEAQGQPESYRRQLEYTNRRILEIIDGILADADEPPIILLQADEGPFPERYRRSEWGFDWRDATEAELEEKFGILNTFLLPGVDATAAGLHPSITPVNSFRIVLNEYFGADMPLLPDRTWAHVDLYRFYDFFDITDRFD